MLAYDDTHSAMDKDRHRFFFEWVDDQRKYHMVNWATMCKPKVFGGLGIINTKVMNVALLTKWVRKLKQNEQGLWADLIRVKYLLATMMTRRSQVWNNIEKIKHIFKVGVKFHVNNGRWIRLWTDTWTGKDLLCDRFPNILAI
jgi:hypothetical protein